MKVWYMFGCSYPYSLKYQKWIGVIMYRMTLMGRILILSNLGDQILTFGKLSVASLIVLGKSWHPEYRELLKELLSACVRAS